MAPSFCFGLAGWTFQDHSLLIHKTYRTSDWIEGSTGAEKNLTWREKKYHAFRQAGVQVRFWGRGAE